MKWTSRAAEIFLNNFWLKFVSVCFAVVLFLIVRSEQVREFNLTGRVKIVTAENVVVVGAQERAVEIQVKLPTSLFSLPPTEEELMGILDVSEQSLGRVRVRLSRYNFPSLDDRYSINVIDPWIEVDLDEVITKKVSVRAVLQGLPADGFSIERVTVSPEDIEVTGARRELENLETLSTSPVNIEAIDQNFSAIAKLELIEPSSIRVTSDKVNVQVFIGENLQEQTFDNVPVSIRNGGRRAYRSSPSVIKVVLRGPEALLSRLKDGDIRAFVDLRGDRTIGSAQKVWLEIPRGTSLLQVEPDTVVIKR